ncbi:MAG: YeiH family protein [Chthoniobacteraceae bacterium]
MSDLPAPTQAPQRRHFTEDWVAVFLAAGLILAVISGWRPQIPKFSWKAMPDLGSAVFAGGNLGNMLLLGGILFVVACIGFFLVGGNVRKFALGFPVIFLLACTSQVLAGYAPIKELGLEYVIFALLIGLLISHLFHIPAWLREAVQTEFYIKTGLVILGAGILFQEILQAGWLGLAQALGVVTVVWYFAFWLSKKLRVDNEFGAMIATAVSICGVSAAIAACGAINGDRKKLSYVTSLVLVVAVPMMIFMPPIVKYFQIPELVAGAWLGGTLDTSGSVVAAGEAISDRAMKTGVIVKFSQNVLIGIAAFVLSIWWTMRSNSQAEKPTARVIWDRFPKFVIGFVTASLVFSFLLPHGFVGETKKMLSGLRTFWFALAFVSIGLETRVTDLISQGGGRPAATFVLAQTANVIWALLLAWLLFGGILFALPNIQ